MSEVTRVLEAIGRGDAKAADELLPIVYQELLTGQRPFHGNNIRQLILQHMQAPPNLSSLPQADQPVIGRGLSKLPTEYPLSVHAYAFASHLVFGLTTELVRRAVRNAL